MKFEINKNLFYINDNIVGTYGNVNVGDYFYSSAYTYVRKCTSIRSEVPMSIVDDYGKVHFSDVHKVVFCSPKLNLEGIPLIAIPSALDIIDSCFVEAPVDFLGTGSDSKYADKEEAQWNKNWKNAVKALKLKKWSDSNLLHAMKLARGVEIDWDKKEVISFKTDEEILEQLSGQSEEVDEIELISIPVTKSVISTPGFSKSVRELRTTADNDKEYVIIKSVKFNV